jgi:hypothetical protein
LKPKDIRRILKEAKNKITSLGMPQNDEIFASSGSELDFKCLFPIPIIRVKGITEFGCDCGESEFSSSVLTLGKKNVVGDLPIL